MKHAGELAKKLSSQVDSLPVSCDEFAAYNLHPLREQTTPMSLPVFDDSLDDADIDKMMENAALATNFLKAIGHEGRLLILCHLASGEKSVAELEELLSARQAAVSQQLGRLRLEGLVRPRREGKAIYYSLTDDRCKRIISVVYDLFCKTD